MSAFDELSDPSRGAGSEFALLLIEVVASVVRSGPFPPPPGASWWDDESVVTLATKFISGESDGDPGDLAPAEAQARMVERADRRMTSITAQAHDDASLKAYLRAGVRHFLVDEAKATVKGRLRRRLETVLQGHAQFAEVPGGPPRTALWYLAGSIDQRYDGDIARLGSAANRVRGRLERPLPSSGPTPRLALGLIVNILDSVLQTARGSVPIADLTEVMATRLNLPGIQLDQAWNEETEAQAPTVQLDSGFELAEYARQLFDLLDNEERQLVPFLGHPPDVQEMVLGLGVGEATALAEMLKARFVVATENDQEATEIVIEVARLCCATCVRKATDADCGCRSAK